LALGAVGALKVLVYGLALPLYTTIDEQFHVELIGRYARGEWPHQRAVGMDGQLMRRSAAFETPEYLYTVEQYTAMELDEPLFRWTYARRMWAEEQRVRHWTERGNYEAHSPPVYYAAAALWTVVVRELWPWSEGRELYVPRLFNAVLYVGFLLVAWRLGRGLWPDRPNVSIAAVALLALAPLQNFHGINSDAMQPLMFAAAMVCMLKMLRAPAPSIGLAAGTGLLTAAAFLVKFSALPIAGMLAVTLALLLRRADAAGRRPWLAAITAAASAAVPVAVVLLRNRYYLGSWSGTEFKLQMLQYGHRDWSDWQAVISHPIFTPGGLWYFLSTFMASFWRGELLWHGQPLTWKAVDLGVAVGGLVLCGAAALVRGSESAIRPGGWLLWTAVGGSILTLMWLSLQLDFSRSDTPGPDMPYLPNGRLVWGALGAAALLAASGLQRLLDRLPWRVPAWAVMIGLGGVMTIAEAIWMGPVLASRWNFFHIP
jgi:hypothetical protein